MSDSFTPIEAWTSATQLLIKEEKISDSDHAFINLAKPLAAVDDVFMISVSSPFIKDRLTKNITSLMQKQLSLLFDRPINILISIDPTLSEQTTPIKKENIEKIETSSELLFHSEKQFQNHSAVPSSYEQACLNPKYTFNTFVVGESNRFAHATALAVSEDPGKGYNPLFLYSESGMGKTHLLHAIGNSTLRLYPEKRIFYISSEEFTNRFINAVKNQKMENFKEQFRNVDVLLIDDIQFLSTLSSSSSTIEEFFHTFNSLSANNKQIVITSDVAPKLLTGLDERMISRFASGIIANIDLPNFETRLAILAKKAEAEQLDVSHSVLDFIASKMTTNVREMEGALRRVAAYSDLSNQPSTLEMAELVLKDMFSNPQTLQITANIIMMQTAGYFDVSVNDLKSPLRTRVLTTPRHIGMYLCRELTDLSLPQIADVFNRRDHTTVISAVKKIESGLAEDQTLFNQVSELTSRIKQAAKEEYQQKLE